MSGLNYVDNRAEKKRSKVASTNFWLSVHEKINIRSHVANNKALSVYGRIVTPRLYTEERNQPKFN